MLKKPVEFRGDSLDALREFPESASLCLALLPEEDAGDEPKGYPAGAQALRRFDEGTVMSKEQRFSSRFGSVWDAIEDTPQQAASMRARSELMMALQSWVKSANVKQADAATLFGITQPRMSDLMRGKINLFSLDALMDMATAAGLEPHVAVRKPKVSKKRPATELLVA